MVGRRGEEAGILGTIVQLVMLSILFAVVWLFINSQTDTTGFFQDFYLHDTQLITELVVAAPGGLLYTYDNLQPELPLEFSFNDGVVHVDIVDGTAKLEHERGYGVYHALVPSTIPKPIKQPFFFSWAKSGNQMNVKEAASKLKSCDWYKEPDDEFRVHVTKTIDGSLGDVSTIQTGIDETARGKLGEKLIYTDEDPNIILNIHFMKGENSVILKPNLVSDSSYLSCVLEQQLLDGTAGVSIKTSNQAGTTSTVELGIHVSQERSADGTQPVPDRLLGQFIGKTLVIYAK